MLIFGIVIVIIILWGNGIIGVENNDELLNQITMLNSHLSEKDILILQYKQEILDWTMKYKKLEETYELTKHSLDMANNVLNQLNIDDINDSADYE